MPEVLEHYPALFFGLYHCGSYLVCFFFQRAFAAFCAISFPRLDDNFAAPLFPPFNPPKRPKA